jgi:hypothetical protein
MQRHTVPLYAKHTSHIAVLLLIQYAELQPDIGMGLIATAAAAAAAAAAVT